MAATIVTSHPKTREALTAKYTAWQAAGEPRVIEQFARPFIFRVTVRDGFFVGEEWESYRISIQGVEGGGDQLRCVWTMKLRKDGQPGAIRGSRPNSRQCYDAYEAWRTAGMPAEVVYIG